MRSTLARRAPGNDGEQLPLGVEAASVETGLGRVLADAEFDREPNPTEVRQPLQRRRLIPAKRGKNTRRLPGVRAEMRGAFPKRWYERRARVESIFSAGKRKLRISNLNFGEKGVYGWRAFER